MIVASAVKLKDGRIFVGERHGDCYAKIKYLGLDKKICVGSKQGFINEYQFFINREFAYYEAYYYKQCKKQEYNPVIYAAGLEVNEEDWKPCLFSEDLW